MNLLNAQVIAAVAASIVLFMKVKPRLFPAVALGASGLEALVVFGVLKLSLGVDLMLILGAALLVAGVAIWLKTSSKHPVTAATVVALVGAVQVLGRIL